MNKKTVAPFLAASLLAMIPGVAGAQAAAGYSGGCTAYGYYGGWGSAPPITAPYAACNSIPSFGLSAECTGSPCPAATGEWGYSSGWGYAGGWGYSGRGYPGN
ncbi:MAG TPA: hypothetical protein VME41_12310 [Stellaceae bacterium]|nr:hypothetical protein [Stellaceae bacterium]